MATAAQVFQASGGRMSFGAQFAFAAYHLGVFEVEGDGINLRNTASDAAFAALGASVTWLTSTGDLAGLAPVNSGDPDFPMDGLSNGVYTSANAAAIVGRVDDALIIGFRGTNDTAGAGDVLIGTPDNDQWGMPEDYYAEFAALIAALDAYVADADNDIDHVYVFGHSLGGAAAEAFMADHAGAVYQAITYASIGNNLAGGNDVPDWRVTNLMIENDIAWWRYGSSHQERGDKNLISIGLGVFWAADIHDMRGYAALTTFLEQNAISVEVLNGTAVVNGLTRDYDRVLLKVNDYDTADGTFTFGLGRDKIAGTAAMEILVGGANIDSLAGGGGGDLLSGGANADRLLGGGGLDQLRGGGGRDVFDFNSIAESGRSAATRDVILDFVRGATGDHIDLSTIDAKVGIGGNDAFRFIGTQAFHHVRGELHFRDAGANVIVEGDVNGDGRADFSILVLNVAALSAGDFIL